MKTAEEYLKTTIDNHNKGASDFNKFLFDKRQTINIKTKKNRVMAEKTKQLGSEPAFPDEIRDGLTKREYFAGLAMQGLLASETEECSFQDRGVIAKQSVVLADALLEELSKKPVVKALEYANINGIMLKRENETEGGIVLEGNTYYTLDEAAAKFGNKVPTRAEWEQMIAPGSTWDAEKKGRWIGVNHAKKKETEFSTFLPAAGWRNNNNGQLYFRGSEGDYWSSTQNGGNAYFLEFSNGTYVRVPTNTRAYGFSVRCVAGNKH